jgi:hypothetical protein
MDEKIVEQLLDELFSSLEAIDTRSSALLQLVKDKRLTADEELAACLEQAGNASSVRWRATRARINYLLTSVVNAAEPVAEKKPAKTEGPGSEPAEGTTAEAKAEKPEKGEKPESRPSGEGKLVSDAPGSAMQSTENLGKDAA